MKLLPLTRRWKDGAGNRMETLIYLHPDEVRAVAAMDTDEGGCYVWTDRFDGGRLITVKEDLAEVDARFLLCMNWGER